MAKNGKTKPPARIANRRALHDFHISAKLECGLSLMGSEVKSLRLGHAQLSESFARIEDGRLILKGCRIDPYKNAGQYGHDPDRDRVLLAHKREIRKLENEASQKGVSLIPLAIYFKGGRAKIEIAVAKGKQQVDKRATIKKREQDRDLRRVMMKRG